MVQADRPAILNKIEITKWVQGTARKMESSGREDRANWNETWLDNYRKLGGRARTTGNKPCPMAAGYGIWYLGLLAGTSRKRQSWTVARVNQELGKNAAYGVIAIDLLSGGSAPDVDSLWRLIQERFEKLTGEVAAINEQGEIKLIIGLFQEQQLVLR